MTANRESKSGQQGASRYCPRSAGLRHGAVRGGPPQMPCRLRALRLSCEVGGCTIRCARRRPRRGVNHSGMAIRGQLDTLASIIMNSTGPPLQKLVATLGLERYRRHIFLCADQTEPNCAPEEKGLEAWAYVKKRLTEWGMADPGPMGHGR